MGGFIDESAVEELVKQVGDALRPLGVTLPMDPQIAYDPSQKAVILQIVALVGDSAFEALGQTDEQRKDRADMNNLAADQHKSRVEEMEDAAKAEIERVLRGEDIFDDPLEQACPNSEDGTHNMHMVENFCVNCNAGLET
jgi:hypothetical protein